MIFHTANGYMPISKLSISAFVLLVGTGAKAQSGFNKHISWWPAYYLKYSINRKWMVNIDLQARNFANQPVVGLVAVRSGVHYNFLDQWTVGAGAAWFHQKQVEAPAKKISSDEVRLWEELRHEVKLSQWQIANQFRTEQRHWTNNDGIAFRFRYKLSADHIFTEKWKGLIGNELMWQSSKVKDDWDQYRIWVGGEYAFNLKNQVQLLLMNWRQFSSHTWQPVVRINFVQVINGAL